MSRWRTYALVTAFSVLIWIFAEAESVRTAKVTVEVVFEGTGSGSGIRVDPDAEGWTGQVSVDLTGTAAAIARATDRLPGQIALRLGREVTAEPGRHLLDLRTVIREVQAVRGSGVSVASASPAAVEFEIAPYAEVPARVEVVIPEGVGRTAAVSEPGRVTLRLPRAVADSLGPDPVVRVSVPRTRVVGLEPGESSVVAGIAVELPEAATGSGWSVTAEPASVSVRVTRRVVTDSVVLRSVPVHLRVGPLDFNRWDLSIPAEEQVLRDVTLTGPADAIARIRDREIPIIATLALSFEELEQGISRKRAEILGLPEGVTYTVDDADVAIGVRRRSAEGE